jgi:hypothetical protein
MDRDHLKDIGVDVRIILKWILKKWDKMAWTGFLWLRTGAAFRILVNSVTNFRVS